MCNVRVCEIESEFGRLKDHSDKDGGPEILQTRTKFAAKVHCS